MRVIFLGGAGEAGRAAARRIAKLDEVEEIIVADVDDAAAAHVAASCAGSARAEAHQIDASSPFSLHRVIRGADIVVNTIGPYRDHGAAVLRAAIDQRVHYIDACDDWEPTSAMLDLAPRAAAAGVCAMVGMGVTPGLSNLLAAKAVEPLDEVLDLHIAWELPIAPGHVDERSGGTAAVEHLLLRMEGQARLVRQGALTTTDSLQPVPLAYPDGRAGTGYVIGHPEPVTFVGSFGVQRSGCAAVLMAPSTRAFFEILRRRMLIESMSAADATQLLREPPITYRARSMLASRLYSGPGDLPKLFALAHGRFGGQTRSVGVSLEGMAASAPVLTSVSLAHGVQRLARGAFRAPGVWPADEVMDGAEIIGDIAERCGMGQAQLLQHCVS